MRNHNRIVSKDELIETIWNGRIISEGALQPHQWRPARAWRQRKRPGPHANHPGEQSEWRATKEAAQKFDIVPHYVPFSGANELDSALGSVGEAHADALLVFPDVLTMVHRARITEFAIAQRLPSMFGWSEYCDAGGLLSYGANQRATYFWLATYADRILRGEKPANLPVHQPTKFELVVNLRTAELLGIDLDKSSVLFRANRVIE